MSTPPGLPEQVRVRNILRITGLVLLVVGLFLFGSGLADFLSTMSDPGMNGPTKFWELFVGLLLLAPAGWCLQAGFLGAASRYVAGETTPVVKDSASYLSDGQGILGVGRTVDDASEPGDETRPHGLSCSACGTRNDTGASFCDHCGHALAG
jgi:hypothetical protein